MFRQLGNLFRKPARSLALSDDLTAAQRQQSSHLLASETVDAADVLFQHPPKVDHVKKQLLFEIALSNRPHGRVTIRRYSEIPLPVTYQAYSPDTDILAIRGFFRYSTSDAVDDWFMNFAHHDLFSGYGHFMFAQDEVQVAEHPVLASLREMLLCRTDRLRPQTVEDDSPTPVLFRGVPRTLRINTHTRFTARDSPVLTTRQFVSA